MHHCLYIDELLVIIFPRLFMVQLREEIFYLQAIYISWDKIEFNKFVAMIFNCFRFRNS